MKYVPLVMVAILAMVAVIAFAVVGTNTQQSPSFVTFSGVLITGLGVALNTYNSQQAKDSSQDTNKAVHNGVLQQKVRDAVNQVLDERANVPHDPER